MEKKQIEIACPCCKSRLLVDVRTGALLRTLRPEQLDDKGRPVVDERDWSEAVSRVQQREETRDSRLEDMLAKERDKGDRLDELFRQAKDKLKEDEDTGEA